MSNSLNESAIRDWVRRKLGPAKNIHHELRVTHLAKKIFALTLPLHNLTPANRKLLTLAALAHDVGRALGDEDHAPNGAQMLLTNTSLPLPTAERRHIAFLTLYHRGKVPAAGREQILLPNDDRPTLRTLLAILRFADSLDKRNHLPPQYTFSLRSRTLVITARTQDPTLAPSLFAKPKKLKLIEQTLQLSIQLKWLPLTSAIPVTARI